MIPVGHSICIKLSHIKIDSHIIWSVNRLLDLYQKSASKRSLVLTFRFKYGTKLGTPEHN